MLAGICQLVSWRVLIAAAVAAATAAENDRAEFYRPPQLFVMTGFIANTTNGTWGTDFIGFGDWTPEKQVAALAEWNKGLGKDYDPEKEFLAFKRAGATGIIFYDKWHDGLVPHDTKLTGYKTERDLVGPTLRAARKLGLKTVVYYSVGLDSNPDPRFRGVGVPRCAGAPHGSGLPHGLDVVPLALPSVCHRPSGGDPENARAVRRLLARPVHPASALLRPLHACGVREAVRQGVGERQRGRARRFRTGDAPRVSVGDSQGNHSRAAEHRLHIQRSRARRHGDIQS